MASERHFTVSSRESFKLWISLAWEKATASWSATPSAIETSSVRNPPTRLLPTLRRTITSPPSKMGTLRSERNPSSTNCLSRGRSSFTCLISFLSMYLFSLTTCVFVVLVFCSFLLILSPFFSFFFFFLFFPPPPPPFVVGCFENKTTHFLSFSFFL